VIGHWRMAANSRAPQFIPKSTEIVADALTAGRA
jgi:hypothetical protein